MPTDIEGLSDEELIQRYVSNYHRDVRAEFRNRMSGAGWRSVEEEGLPDNGGIYWVYYKVEHNGELQQQKQCPAEFRNGKWINENGTELKHDLPSFSVIVLAWYPLPNPPEEG